MDKKSKKANEILMRRVNNKINKKDWNDGTPKIAPRKKNETTTEKRIAERNVYDRGDSKLSEPQKDGRISLENLIEDINRRAAVKLGLKKKKDIEKPKTFVAKNINNIAPKRSNEKPVEEAHYKFSDSKERKKIFDKYTIKLKGEGGNHNISTIIVNREDVKKPNENVDSDCCYRLADRYYGKNSRLYLEMACKNKESDLPELTGKKEEPKTNPIVKKDTDKTDIQRKAIIKTVASKNESKIYKAVTFGNNKKLTQLQINMPNDTHRQSARSARTRESSARVHDKETSDSKIKTNSKTSIKDKPKRKKKETANFSPDILSDEMMPQTEVAMWAPASVNPHTKPYYEAWVNKTLAAISRLTVDDEDLKKKTVVTSFYSVYDRPSTPDLTYANYADERYTGRIKVTQR